MAGTAGLERDLPVLAAAECDLHTRGESLFGSPTALSPTGMLKLQIFRLLASEECRACSSSINFVGAAFELQGCKSNRGSTLLRNQNARLARWMARSAP